MFDAKRQVAALDGEIEKTLVQVAAKGWYVLGDYLKKFENQFAKDLGFAHAIGVASGTDALKLSLVAAGMERGKKVVLPANSPIPTAMAVIDAGFVPAFCDVDKETLLADARCFENALAGDIGGIIPVHLYGRPCEMTPIMEMTKKKKLRVIEDCAQAHGAKYEGRPVGSFGIYGAFSFYPSKNLGAMGDAGAVVTMNKTRASKIKELRNYGLKNRYRCDGPGCNSRLDEIQAAVLLVKLAHLEKFNRRRIEIGQTYVDELKELDLVLPEVSKGHVFHLFVIRLDHRDSLLTHLEKLGIASRIHYPVPLHLQKAFSSLGYKKGDFPVAESESGRILSIPLFSELTDDEIARVVHGVRSFFKG